MAISQEQQKRGLEHLKQIRRKYFSESSEAAEWWDNLTPEWRGVVLHAAAVTSGRVASSNSAQTHLGATNSAGAHTHSVSGTAASAGEHKHTVGIGAHTHSVAIGSHGHTITVNAAGTSENTVKNIALNYIVRLA